MKQILGLTLSLCILLCACNPQPQPTEDGLTLLATTYPIYLLLTQLVEDVEGVSANVLVNQEVSCLHDYTLTVNEMKALESANVVFYNGAGLDDFIMKSLKNSKSDSIVVDCSQGISPLHPEDIMASADHDHDHESPENMDPHYWMHPDNTAVMLHSMAQSLSTLDPDNAHLYEANATAAVETLQEAYARLQQRLDSLAPRQIITFHNGFAYFAQAFDLEIILAVEEEEGQEASAQVIAKALTLIEDFSLPAIFTEEHSSDATAQAIAREAHTTVAPLSLMMSGTDVGIAAYIAGLEGNINAILEAYS